MISRMSITASAEAKAPIGEVCDVLLQLIEWRSRDLSQDIVKGRLPDWLLEQFSSEMSLEHKRQWLSRWRAASPSDKAALERERGWEFSQWCYWFMTENTMWSISSASIADDKLIVEVLHEDEPIPVGALEWTFEVAGMKIESMERIL